MLPMMRLFALIVFTVGLVSCAGTPESRPTLEQKLAEKNYRLGEPVERIQQWRLDSWAYLDRQHVIMQTAPSTYYLVSLRDTCHGLDSAEDIAFTTTANQLTNFDKLLVRSSGGLVDRCYIIALHKLEKIGKKEGS